MRIENQRENDMVWFEKMKIELKQDGKIGTGRIEKELENKREKKADSNWEERRIEKRSRFEDETIYEKKNR